MKMQDLKKRVYETWKNLSVFNGAVVQAENFKAEVRQIGDLRYKRTWEAAYCQFSARNMMDSCLDAFTLITIRFNPSWWEPELRYLLPRCLDEFLALPEGIDAIKQGLEQLLGDYTTTQEKESAHEFFEMARQQSRGFGGDAAQLAQLLQAN